MRTSAKKLAISSCILFIVLLALHIHYYGDFQTTLRSGEYLKDGASDLKAASWSVPVVVDWDSDGKKDLLVGHNHIDSNKTNHGYVRFYRNAGTDSSPAFNGYTYVQTCSSICTPLDAAAFG